MSDVKTKTKTISKSRIKEGLQCPKYMYLSITQPDLKAPVTPAQQAIFDTGNEVGELARTHFEKLQGTKGTLIDTLHWDIKTAIEFTDAAIKDKTPTKKAKGQTIFEASFSDGTLYCRVDILHRDPSDDPSEKAWHLIEVKSGSSAKEDYIEDLTIQALILKNKGFPVKSYQLMYLNKNALYPNLEELFVIEDLTEDVEARMPEMKARIAGLLEVLQGKDVPKQHLGNHCYEPHECPFKALCWKDIPEYSVFDLPRIGVDKAAELMRKGHLDLLTLKEGLFSGRTKTEQTFLKVIEVTKTGKRWVDEKALAKAVSTWEYPLHFLDFETVNPAIPRYEGTGPFAKIPFQFSCHVLQVKGGELKHSEFLHLDVSDPREGFVRALVAAVGDHGSVVSYNSSFEKQVMEKLIDQYPKFKKQLQSIISRLVDPYPLMVAAVYDKAFRGKFTLKRVAPALLGKEFSYALLDIGGGQDAAVVAEKCLRGAVVGGELERVRESLLKYCALDTMAMVKLVEWVQSIHGEK